jgi:hypothetical protein
MTDEPAVYSAQELELLNKYFLRNRLRMISRPVHAQYIKQLLLDWGGPKLLSKLQDSELNFKEELLGDCLREVKKFKEITKLGEALDADLKGKSPGYQKSCRKGISLNTSNLASSKRQ